MTLLYDGKAKQLFSGPQPHTVIVSFKDSATAGNAAKRALFPQKGALCNTISSKLFELLAAHNLDSHYIRKLNEESFLAHNVHILPLEVVVRNRATGSITKRLGIVRGRPFQPPLLELFYKSDALGDPLLCESHAQVMGLATERELTQIKEQALRANEILKIYFAELDLQLIDMKFEFGRPYPHPHPAPSPFKGEGILLADEISPDTMRLWDAQTNESLDKDVFREDKGDLISAYREVARRMGVL
ncbi:phosphoribosylaminoimidazolesuccinocarboxamide synthase [Candidatus Acetothermia bacterium]|jgi:phosphoribosylaminoimidazole-succinocarboxamide synthase|nr:phosphoribosylaminoimidazolesuccinocarboxamide synthase [Candidatus Acetothermia bacterium]MCI2432008.1 phosphoribosylaminoimidazolesuccinocarboxamide synthase [Candidatus Acetothermia bacterium]MCI2436805.1 phosphoribosylaminoimidazolesuccinocarboxamide synthase [Candidatus Acetothermia bacterium]